MKTDGPTKPNRPETLTDKMGCLLRIVKKKKKPTIHFQTVFSLQALVHPRERRETVHSSIFYAPAYRGSQVAWSGSSMHRAKGWEISWTDCQSGTWKESMWRQGGRANCTLRSGHRTFLLWGNGANRLATSVPKCNISIPKGRLQLQLSFS